MGADLAFWLCIAANAGICIALMTWLRRGARSGAYSARVAKTVYTVLCAGTAIFSGVVLFYGSVALFGVFVGHGEVLIAAPLWNVVLSGAMVPVGRIVIGWEPVKW